MYRKTIAVVLVVGLIMVFSAVFFIAATNIEVPMFVRVLIILWFLIYGAIKVAILCDGNIHYVCKAILLFLLAMTGMFPLFDFSEFYPKIEHPLLYIIQSVVIFYYLGSKIWSGKYLVAELDMDAF